ncbi:MAG: hypothetical protein ACXAE3_03715 [Candidatus Kariarchaeaceae archaeon]
MKQIILAVELALDELDMSRLEATAEPYLYHKDSRELYLKHIRHLDYHHPNIVISYDKTHEIINLKTGSRKSFYITNEGLDKPVGVAVGVTDHLAMIAMGDTQQTKIQVVDVNQPLKVFLNTTYFKDNQQLFPIPKLFSGNPQNAQLVYFDNSTLDIDLQTFDVSQRRPPTSLKAVSKLLSPHFTLLGPFLLIRITPKMSRETLKSLELLVHRAMEGPWVAIDDTTIIHRDRAPATIFDEILDERERQYAQIRDILAS